MQGPTVLVVEDNPLTRKVVRVALQSEGFTVLEAENGGAGLALLAAQRPDVVLQDLVLPDIDGLDLVKQLRALPGGDALPILAFSAFPSKLAEARNVPAGFTDYLLKPVEPSRLVAIIRSYMLPGTETAELHGRGRRLLVVDDDPLQRKLLRIHFEQLGFEVATAEDGIAGLEQARRSPPDAIVSDVLMPRLDGFKFCLAVRQDPRLARVPVVLTSSAFIEEADQRLAESVGASAFVVRTPDMRDVVQALLTSLDIQSPAPAAELPAAEYTDRVVKQLERQSGLSADLARKLAWLEAKLEILSGLAETLKRKAPVETLVDEILQRALEAAGTPKGAAYLIDPHGRLYLRATLGYPDGGPVRQFFGHADLLQEVLASPESVAVPSRRVSGDRARDLLAKAGVGSLLITPLVAREEPLGALVIAWTGEERQGDLVFFATVIASQVSQAIALARALAQLRESVKAEQQARADAEAAQRRLAFLAKASSVLAESLDYETTLAKVVRLAVPDFADWCAVDVIREDGSLHRLDTAYGSPAPAAQAPDPKRRLAPSRNAASGVSKVVRTGQPELYPEIPASLVAAAARDAGHLRILRGLGLRSAMIVPLIAHGRTLAAITFATAESERRYGPDDLSMAQELAYRCAVALENARLYRESREALRLRDEFISIAAHELRTPITSLRGYAQLVLRELDKASEIHPEHVARAMTQIVRQGDRLTKLVVQLLDVARLEGGRLAIAPERTDLALLVKELVAHVRRAHPQREIALRSPEAMPVVIDSLRVEQVITNLIDNALKFSPADEAIEVEVGTCQLDGVRIAVRDHGVGIPAEKRPRLFERFFQAHEAGYYGGMGLGLYISRQIVELHGGSIVAESPEDGGTRFVIVLPCRASVPDGASHGEAR